MTEEIPASGHRIVVDGQDVDEVADSARVRFHCEQPDCVHGEVEASPARAAGAAVQLLVDRHRGDLVLEYDGTGLFRLRESGPGDEAIPTAEVTFHNDAGKGDPDMPGVGKMVHYVSYGTPGGEYASVCRAAVIAAVAEDSALPVIDDDRGGLWSSDTVVCDLVVFNPGGLFFNRCPQDEAGRRGGTWHELCDGPAGG